MDEAPRDGDRSLLEELWTTPVGRRWVLKAGLGSALAVTARMYGGPAVAAAAKPRSKRTTATDLQFALGAAHHLSDLELVAGGSRYKLRRHTEASRRALRATGGLWKALDLAALTHYVAKVPLPAERGMLLSVHGRRGKHEVVVSQLWHAPSQATQALAGASHRLTGSLGHVAPSARRLKALGLGKADIQTAAQVAELDKIGDTYQTAVALTMCHPNVATIDPTATAATKSLLGQTPAVQALGQYIAQMHQQGKDFASLVPATDPNGKPSQIKIGTLTTSFSTIKLNGTDSGFMDATKSSVSAGVVGVRNTGTLGAVINQPLDQAPSASTKTWVQPQGVVSTPQPYTVSLKAGAGIDISIKNTGTLFGTKTVANGSYANGKVPLKIYNNFVRWLYVYVQYLGANGENLSANPSATFPDTKYSKAVAIVPQVFTVLGVPLWDTNTVEVSLEFPEGAHTARLLYCGLGSDINGGGWRQYFPSNAYPDSIAPTTEVLLPALTTAIMSIGLNVFALAADVDIAVTWKTLNKMFADGPVALEALQQVLRGAIPLTATETATVALASGGATYLDITNSGENVNNLWSILLGLGTVIPKIIFNPNGLALWLTVGSALLAEVAAEKLLDAIPFVGEVVAIVSAIGDVATLAEVCAETIVAPWVIENEVSLTYPAKITISRDPRSSTFPATATSWRLEALIDGTLALQPITGQINQGGKIQSNPLVLNVTAPFGGQKITWSLVMLDASGNQVGTGVSPQFTNNDPGHPASTVAFAITELPATITATTVFERADTTTYSASAGGYTWSDQVTDTGTVASTGIQEVTGATVATLAGVAGAVWKQNDRYWLRGVPLAQNGATIKLQAATKEGYARRPFLLLDAFVAPSDLANHVLLEPDATSDAYHIRTVSLDSVTGKLSWDSTVSHGTFTLPVSAAALHSSGRVVAIHTDSGRFAWLQPAATPRPALAAYSAGPGTQVGLLSSPIALAVTNPGVVLVLEAATSQLAAFDLNGNPVQYFEASTALRPRRQPAFTATRRRRLGDSPALQYTLPLVSTGTYLDLAVDGASQIYVLYYTGDGSAVSDYHVDVYTPTGATLDTHSPGVNIPHLAVDYWRSIFAANYDPLTQQGTTVAHIDPALGVAEPSVSRFDPRQPALGKPRPKKRHHKPKKHHHSKPPPVGLG